MPPLLRLTPLRSLMQPWWYHECDGGRVFYTSLGHKIEYYSDPVFRQHILGGIRWVMGEKD